MKADSYFEIGSTHQVCQDYALSGVLPGMSYGIVSDGCSTAPNSEIGAQILAYAAKNCIELYSGIMRGSYEFSSFSSMLGNAILQKADIIRKIYPIDYNSLQATLMIAVMLEKRGYVFVWGDGVIVKRYKRENGFISGVTHIDYPNNAPFYLSTDQESYQRKFGADSVVKFRKSLLDNTESPVGSSENVQPFHKFYCEEVTDISYNTSLHSISIMSDGVLQYLDENVSPVPVDSVLEEMLDYSNYNGPFVARTMNFLKRQLIRKKWTHADDISIATIVRD